ncbi:MAG: sodium:solute symporter family protein [Saprospiraceae bacterium]|nr:sodium:solute symporter family protein [Saprospiraceae bacterium]
MSSLTKNHVGKIAWQSAIVAVFLLVVGWVIDYTGAVRWPAYLVMVFFYVVIFVVAIGVGQQRDSDHILANKSLPLWMAVFTMSATWVGGGFINGTAEYTYSSGLIWVQAPWGYAMSLLLGGLFFARPMRRRGYTTMLDPLEEAFGKKLNLIFFVPALMGDVFWTAAILVALGTTFGIILGISAPIGIILSAIVVILYTSIGGFWSVAATDVVQMIMLMSGLVLVVIALFSGERSILSTWIDYRAQLGDAALPWPNRAVLGSSWAYWIDISLLLMLGGIPWQVYFQRVLASKTERVAVRLSIFSAFVCVVAAIPSVMIGMVGVTTDWSTLGLAGPNSGAEILPYVIQHLTPSIISAVGLGAVAAAVMSSADSSILAAASLTTFNVLSVKQSDQQGRQKALMRKLIWIIGIATLLLALKVTSIYALWVLCSDFVYCLLFPALVTALFDPRANGRGAIAGFTAALILRSGGGEASLGIDPWIPYPMDGESILLPFRTLAMLANLVLIMAVSRIWPDRH